MKRLFSFICISLALSLLPPGAASAEEREINLANTICTVYFTGVGCSHCAQTDPVILEELPKKYPNLVVIEYEIYQAKENAPLLLEYDQAYGSGLGIPLIISDQGHLAGDRPILENVDSFLEKSKGLCPLIDGSSLTFEDLDLASLPGQPKIWTKDKVLIREGKEPSVNDELLKGFLLGHQGKASLKWITDPRPVPLSGKSISFDRAMRTGGWLFQWNGEGLGEAPAETIHGGDPFLDIVTPEEPHPQLTLAKVLSLAAVDAVNPCALAVLTLMLIAILTYNPRKRRNILLAGLAFSASVLVMYLIYGLVIIRFFQLVQALTSVRLWLYKILGTVAVILGILNIKDFLAYKPGGLGTEMPLGLRPKVKKIISGVTSPKGAAVVGAFVTVFLLPCTIGPYIICGGILCPLSLLEALPWLLLYNIIFILPMLVITIVSYAGFTTVEKVSGWKDKNIRYLHLIAGLIIFGLGLAMLLGWV